MIAPVVTIGMPLYRSLRYLDFITRNIEGIGLPNAEIIISDRHCFDDTLERLAARFPGDKRLRFIAATDGIGWVENYNLLLKEASGRYFGWMSHDDFYPPQRDSRSGGMSRGRARGSDCVPQAHTG